jgi:putative transposase
MRVIQTLQAEVLDCFYVFGERHPNYIVRDAVYYYHTCRPHQGLENELILPMKGRRKTNPAEVIPMSNIGCKSRLGGLLNHYYRKAA